jgi:hypothetical protein
LSLQFAALDEVIPWSRCRQQLRSEHQLAQQPIKETFQISHQQRKLIYASPVEISNSVVPMHRAVNFIRGKMTSSMSNVSENKANDVNDSWVQVQVTSRAATPETDLSSSMSEEMHELLNCMDQKIVVRKASIWVWSKAIVGSVGLIYSTPFLAKFLRVFIEVFFVN